MILRLLAAEARFDPVLLPYRARADRIMVGMCAFLALACLAIAPLRGSWAPALLLGAPTAALAWWQARSQPGALATRLFMGCAFMTYTGLIIHQTGGDIEAHFTAFGLIGTLLYYRDWRTIVVATLFVYLHHLLLGYAQSLGNPVYVFDGGAFWPLFGIHVAYFLPFIAMMCYLAIWLRRDGYEAQHVIATAQAIAQGHLTEDTSPSLLTDTPLIGAVSMMKRRLLDLLRVMPVAAAVIRIDDQTLVSINDAWLQRIGPRPAPGLPCAHWPLWQDTAQWPELLTRVQQSPERLLNKEEIRLHRIDGGDMLCELSLTLHQEVMPAMAILTLEDITLRRQAEQTMQRLAYRDMLTGLCNRTSLYARLDAAQADWLRYQTPFAVLLIDLDNFKPINDNYGHDAGDRVLQQVATRIQHCVRQSDLPARLGGDEFVVVFGHCPNRDSIRQLADRLIHELATPIALGGGVTACIGASAGLAHIADSSGSVDDLLQLADQMMYQAKRAGKNHVVSAGAC